MATKITAEEGPTKASLKEIYEKGVAKADPSFSLAFKMKEYEQIETQLRYLSTMTKNLQGGLGSFTRGLATSFEDMSENAKKLKVLNQMDKVLKGMHASDRSTAEGIAQFRERLNEMRNEIKGTEHSVGALQKSTEQFKRQVKEGIRKAVVESVRAVIQQNKQFEEWRTMQHKSAEEVNDAIESLSRAGAAVAMSSEDVAKAATTLRKSGITDITQDTMMLTGKLARTMGVDASTAAGYLAKKMQMLNLNEKQVQKTMDRIVKAQGALGVSGQEAMEAFERFGPLMMTAYAKGEEAGGKFEQGLIQVIGVYKQLGVSSEGTMDSIKNAMMPTRDGLKDLAMTAGMTGYSIDELMRIARTDQPRYAEIMAQKADALVAMTGGDLLTARTMMERMGVSEEDFNKALQYAQQGTSYQKEMHAKNEKARKEIEAAKPFDEAWGKQMSDFTEGLNAIKSVFKTAWIAGLRPIIGWALAKLGKFLSWSVQTIGPFMKEGLGKSIISGIANAATWIGNAFGIIAIWKSFTKKIDDFITAIKEWFEAHSGKKKEEGALETGTVGTAGAGVETGKKEEEKTEAGLDFKDPEVMKKMIGEHVKKAAGGNVLVEKTIREALESTLKSEGPKKVLEEMKESNKLLDETVAKVGGEVGKKEGAAESAADKALKAGATPVVIMGIAEEVLGKLSGVFGATAAGGGIERILTSKALKEGSIEEVMAKAAASPEDYAKTVAAAKPASEAKTTDIKKAVPIAEQVAKSILSATKDKSPAKALENLVKKPTEKFSKDFGPKVGLAVSKAMSSGVVKSVKDISTMALEEVGGILAPLSEGKIAVAKERLISFGEKGVIAIMRVKGLLKKLEEGNERFKGLASSWEPGKGLPDSLPLDIRSQIGTIVHEAGLKAQKFLPPPDLPLFQKEKGLLGIPTKPATTPKPAAATAPTPAPAAGGGTPGITPSPAPAITSPEPIKAVTPEVATGGGGGVAAASPAKAEKVPAQFTGSKGELVQQLKSLFMAQGMTKEQTAALLAKINLESGFVPKSENLNYSSADRIKYVFKRLRSLGDSVIQTLVRNPQGLAEAAYGAVSEVGRKMGNLSEGEGWKYRGRGFIQITGKSNYKKFGEAIGEDLLNNPDLANDPIVAGKIAVAFMKAGQGAIAKALGIKDLTKMTQAEADAVAVATIGGSAKFLRSEFGSEILGKVRSSSAQYAAEGALISSPTHLIAGEAGPEIVAPKDAISGIASSVMRASRGTLKGSQPELISAMNSASTVWMKQLDMQKKLYTLLENKLGKGKESDDRGPKLPCGATAPEHAARIFNRMAQRDISNVVASPMAGPLMTMPGA